MFCRVKQFCAAKLLQKNDICKFWGAEMLGKCKKVKKGPCKKSSAWERGAADLTSINNLTLIESYHDGNDLSGIGLAFVYNEYFTAIYALRL